jgi:hypothetical protein
LLLILLSMLQVSPHEIVVVNEDHYMDLWTEMGDWVEDDGMDDAAQQPPAANTVCISFKVVALRHCPHFGKR